MCPAECAQINQTNRTGLGARAAAANPTAMAVVAAAWQVTRCSQTIRPTHFCPCRPLATSDASPIYTAIETYTSAKTHAPYSARGSHKPRTTSILRACSSAGPTPRHQNSSQPKHPGHTQSSASILPRCPHRTNLDAVFADLAFILS